MLGAFNAEENDNGVAEEINDSKEDVNNEAEKEDHKDVEEVEKDNDNCSDDNDDDVVIESVEDIGKQKELLPRIDEVDEMLLDAREV